MITWLRLLKLAISVPIQAIIREFKINLHRIFNFCGVVRISKNEKKNRRAGVFTKQRYSFNLRRFVINR